MAMIEAEGLTKRFGDNLAVDHIDLDIAEGEVFGFLGPNGAGKTTTVRILSALIAPNSGTATINGFRIDNEAQQVRQCTGILTETPGLYARLDAVQNLRFFAELYGMKNVQAQVKKYLELVQLWDRRNEPVGGFSKGMRQRVAIARALLNEPPVLFLDEPTAGLDPANARVVREFIEELKSQGRTIFICTHNLDEAERLCDRIAVMRRKLIRVEAPSELRRDMYGRAVMVRLAEATHSFREKPLFKNYKAIIEGFDFVEYVSVKEDGRLRIVLDDLETHNPVIVKALVDAGASVQFVEEEEHSLEKVYLDLIAEDEQAASQRGGESGEEAKS